jgi:hypothetical protein
MYSQMLELMQSSQKHYQKKPKDFDEEQNLSGDGISPRRNIERNSKKPRQGRRYNERA